MHGDVRDVERARRSPAARPGRPGRSWSRTSSGSRPASYAATRHRSISRGARLRVGDRRDDRELVGVGDDDPLDRVGVVGGAAQHRPCAARPARCGRARPSAPSSAPTSATRSPTTTPLRPSSRAFIAVTSRAVAALVRPGSRSGRGRRSRPTPATASSCAGRSLVRGRDLPRPGRTRTSSSSRSRRAARGSPAEHPEPAVHEAGQRLAGGRDVDDPDARDRQARARPRRWPAGGRRRSRTPRRAAGPGRIVQAVRGLGRRRRRAPSSSAASAASRSVSCPRRWATPRSVVDAGGQRGQRGGDRDQLADVDRSSSPAPTQAAGPVDHQRAASRPPDTPRPERLEQVERSWSHRLQAEPRREPGDLDPAAGHQGRGGERQRVGQVRPRSATVAAARAGPARPTSHARRRRCRPATPRAASIARVIATCGSDGSRRPDVDAPRRPVVVARTRRAAGALTNWLDALGVDRRPRRRATAPGARGR